MSIFKGAVALGAAALALAGCAGMDQGFHDTVKAGPPKVIDGVVYLDQGWKDDARQWYYYTTQGSRLIPYDWFMALNDPKTGKPVSGSLTDLGYLPATKGKDNPDNLAVGFVKDGVGPAASLGLTCAACHTNDLKVGDKVIRVDGAGATGDLYGFLTLIQNALANVSQNDAAFQVFAAKVLGPNAGPAEKLDLYAKVKAFRVTYDDFVKHSSTKVAWGPARTDAFGMIFNRVSAIDLKYPKNNRPPAAPVSYPHLWSAPQQPKNQWDGLVANANAVDALGRNAGEVLGVFGEANLKRPTAEYYAYRSSVRVGNLLDMEAQLRGLQTPVWPESILGRVDTVKAAEGKKLYEQACLSCHAYRPRTNNPNTPTKIELTPLFTYKIDPTKAVASICSKGVAESVKAGAIAISYASDPKMAVDAGCRTVETRQLSGVKMPPVIGPALKSTDSAAALLTNAVLGTIIGKTVYEDPLLIIKILEQMLGEKLTDGEKAALRDHKTFSGDRKDADAKSVRGKLGLLALKVAASKAAGSTKQAKSAFVDPFVYKARPLDGIWATAPYMHNGSVPSLYEMLLPADKRSKRFPVGSGAFDPKTVGLPTVGIPEGYWFDATQEGNVNSGHEWGGDWTDAQRWSLVEYLKTL